MGLVLPRLKRQVMVLARGNHHDAEDLLQDCLIALHRSLPAWRGEARFSTWLYRLARNTCIDRLRSWGAERRRLERLAEAPPSSDPVRLAEERFDTEILLGRILSLSLEHRELINLAELEELPLAEIGERLGLPIGTVKSRLSRARKALAGLLSKEDFHAHAP